MESAPAPGKRLDSNTDPLLSEMTRYLWLQLREKYVDSNGSGSAYRCSEPHSRVETLKYNCHPSREFDIGMGIGYWISAAERRFFFFWLTKPFMPYCFYSLVCVTKHFGWSYRVQILECSMQD